MKYNTEMVAVMEERKRQLALWGKQHHDYGTWLTIFIEEVGEVAQAMQAGKGWGKDSDANNLYKELIQASAVALEFAEQVREDGEKQGCEHIWNKEIPNEYDVHGSAKHSCMKCDEIIYY